MNVFDKIRDGLDPAKNGVGDFFHGVPQEAQKPLQDALNKIMQQLEQVGRDLESAANHGKETIYNEMVKRQGELVSNVERVGGDTLKKIEGVGSQLVDEIESEIKSVAKKIQDEFKSGAAKRMLKLLLALAKDNPVSAVNASISIISFSLPNPGDKVALIEQAVNKPPNGHKEIIEFLEKLDIGTLSINISGEIFTSAVSFSVGADVSISKAIEFIDNLEQHIEEAVKI